VAKQRDHRLHRRQRRHPRRRRRRYETTSTPRGEAGRDSRAPCHEGGIGEPAVRRVGPPASRRARASAPASPASRDWFATFAELAGSKLQRDKNWSKREPRAGPERRRFAPRRPAVPRVPRLWRAAGHLGRQVEGHPNRSAGPSAGQGSGRDPALRPRRRPERDEPTSPRNTPTSSRNSKPRWPPHACRIPTSPCPASTPLPRQRRQGQEEGREEVARRKSFRVAGSRPRVADRAEQSRQGSTRRYPYLRERRMRCHRIPTPESIQSSFQSSSAVPLLSPHSSSMDSLNSAAFFLTAAFSAGVMFAA
jgi:hypothetical protein